MKILVVGGAGYIGSHAVLSLVEKGKDVVVFDSLELGHKEAIDRINKKLGSHVEIFTGNLKNKEDLDKLFSKYKDIESVIHFAAYSLVGESVPKPSKYYENNVYGSLNLFDALIKNNIKKLVFSSTAATYGIPDVEIIKEDTPQRPMNPYGKSKLMVENILDDLFVSDKFCSIRLRYFNVAGASHSGLIGEDHTNESHLIPNALKTAAGVKDKFTLTGTDFNTKDGTAIRDYIHVEDLIDAHILALEYLDTHVVSDYFNLGSKNGFSVEEIVDKCKEITGIDFKVEKAERRAGDPDKLIADSTKANTILGWEIQRDLDTIIKDAWNWHKNNPNGFSK